MTETSVPMGAIRRCEIQGRNDSTKIFKKKNLPTHVFVSAYRAEGLEQHSIALCEQVTALDYGRIIENMGKVDEETLARITEAVQVQVGVFDKYNR